MSDLITIPRSDWREMKEAIEAFKELVIINDLVNRKQACEIMGWSTKTFSTYQIPYDHKNEHGVRFYSRKRLLGLKKQKQAV